jgi:hypothetical protein
MVVVCFQAQRKGVKSLYRGASLQVARDVGFGMFYFYTYQVTQMCPAVLIIN